MTSSKATLVFPDTGASVDNDNDNSADHRCRLYDVPTFLFDMRWKGSDGARLELVDAASAGRVGTQLRETLASSNLVGQVVLPDGAEGDVLLLENVSYTDPVDPKPVLTTYQHVLWLEPNKLSKLAPAERFTRSVATAEIIANEIAHCMNDQRCVLQLMKTRRDSGMNTSCAKVNDTLLYIQQRKRRLQQEVAAALEPVDKDQDTYTPVHTTVLVDSCSVCERIVRVFKHHEVVGITPEATATTTTATMTPTTTTSAEVHTPVRHEEDRK